MPDNTKTKLELIAELNSHRARIVELERREQETRRDLHKLNRKYQFFKSFIDELIEPILFIDTHFRVKYANKAAYQLSDWNPEVNDEEPFCHKLLFGTDFTCDQEGQNCLLKKVMEEGKHVIIDHTVEKPGEEDKIYEILGSPIWEGGNLIGIVSTIRDVTQYRLDQQLLEAGHDFLEMKVQERTYDLVVLNKALRQEIAERQETERKLRWAKERAELLYKVSPCAIFTVNKERDVTSWNNKIEEITGYSHDEIKGRKCDIFCTEPCALFSDHTRKPILNKECFLTTKDGRKLYIMKSADLLLDPEGNVIGGIESFEDITHRKQMQDVLRSERDKFQGMIAATQQGLHIINASYEIEFQNDVLAQIFGNKIGHKCYEVYRKYDHPCENCSMHRVIKSSKIEHITDIIINNRHYSQSYAPFKDVDGQMKCLVLLRDITVERANQAKTMRTAQLASIGELAAGVAHEINNPINGIINYAQILLDESKGDETQNSLLERLIDEGERVADIVSKLLDFARQREDEEGNFELVDVSKVLDDAYSLFKHQFRKSGVITEISFTPDIPPIWVHPHQLQQVFVNLLSNANHALNERYKGPDPNKILKISTEKITLDDKNHVRISFTDHGTGIAAEIIDLVFNPFFSTKDPGEGTGLGLSISQGLIQNFRGQLHLESKVGQYTKMMVDLPVPPDKKPAKP